MLHGGPALAGSDLIKIVEICPGTAAQPRAQYVMLQAYATDQTSVIGHPITVFDNSGNLLATFGFNSNIRNGHSQSNILIGTAATQSFFGVVPDLQMSPVIALGGGKICYDVFDCVSWGTFAGDASAPSPSGEPFAAATGLTLGDAMRRNLAADGTLSAADDTDDSAADFHLASPYPRNNFGETGNILCVGACNQSVAVTVDALVTMVNIALGDAPLSVCLQGDANHDGSITVDEILTALDNALNGCPA